MCANFSTHADLEQSVKIVLWNEKAREFVKNLDNETKIEIGTLILMLQ